MLKRGGIREKSGRKKIFIQAVNVNSRLEKSELELIEKLGTGKTKSEKIRSIILLGLKAFETQQN